MFSLPESQDIYILKGEYSPIFVIISILIACCAAYTALSMNQRMQHSSFFHKNFWLFLSSIAMGLGIWSMHFIGMSAFMLPITMEYDVPLTIISIIPAIFASYMAFYFANNRNTTWWTYAIAGIIMGIGISSMHYIGMAAMKMEAGFYYIPWIFASSIAIAVVISYIALFTFSTLQKYMRNQLVKIVTSLLMGSAIASMHYVGMFAVVFYVKNSLIGNIHKMHMMDTSLLITVIAVGIFFLLLIFGLTSLLDRYVDYRLKHFDPLTLFPNQRQFEHDLFSTTATGSLAIIHIHSLEKWINSKGYLFGDNIIKKVSNIIKNNTPKYAKVYRIERYRFAIFQFGKSEHGSMKSSMEEILAILKNLLSLGNRHINVEIVCSLAATDQKMPIRDLFSNCMAVLNHPSIEYKHEVIEYDPSVHVYSFENDVVQSIHKAISNNELYLEYQPKICSKSFKVSGVEALVRWKHPEYDLISPGVFIPILEKNGRIFKLTDWIIQEVCRQAAVWIDEGVPFQQISINIPGSYVTSPRLLEVISENLLTYNLDSKYIELEITETSVIEDVEYAISAANRLRELGLSVALDDFGTGLSSLSYLKRIPISVIKIDKSFVDGVPHSQKDSSVLKAIIKLCNSLNLKVVIEGVETKEQIDFILSMEELPHIQGYYFSRPLASKKAADWICRGITSELNQGS